MGTSRLTILFDDPFWIGLYERGGRHGVLRLPDRLRRGAPGPGGLRLSSGTLADAAIQPAPARDRASAPPKSPKRRQREARRMTQAAGIGTKAQQALKLQQEQGKQARLARTRQQREAEEARKFQLRQARRRKSTEVTDLCAFSGTVFIRGLRRRQTLL